MIDTEPRAPHRPIRYTRDNGLRVVLHAFFNLAILPSPGGGTGLSIGVGPTLNFPTTARDNASVTPGGSLRPSERSTRAILGLVLGDVAQHRFSAHDTKRPHSPGSTRHFKPIALAYVGHGFYVKSSDSTWSHSWGDGDPTTPPLSFGIGYVSLRDGSSPINVSVSGEWIAYRHDALVAPQTLPPRCDENRSEK